MYKDRDRERRKRDNESEIERGKKERENIHTLIVGDERKGEKILTHNTKSDFCVLE
jgi:hypothetical protein